MRIAQIAPLAESVPPPGYGGTELVVSLLCEGLVSRGHEVTLFASGDSQTAARLVSVTEEGLRKQSSVPQSRWAAYDIRSLLKVIELESDFDLIHNHMGYQALPILSNMQIPVLSTNHNPVKEYNRDIYLNFRHLPFVSISRAYQRLNLFNELNYVATVYNGIDLQKYKCEDEIKRDHLLFVGRISRDKGAAVAIDMALEIGMPLRIAGKIDAGDRHYYETEILPRLAKSSSIRFLGEVGEADKVRLYGEAYAVLYPIDFEEPFGLVMVESLASGAPVLALNRGSVSELLKDGENSIIENDPSALVARFAELSNIDRKACRAWVNERFSKEKMVENYINTYIQLLEAGAEKRLSASSGRRA